MLRVATSSRLRSLAVAGPAGAIGVRWMRTSVSGDGLLGKGGVAQVADEVILGRGAGGEGNASTVRTW